MSKHKSHGGFVASATPLPAIVVSPPSPVVSETAVAIVPVATLPEPVLKKINISDLFNSETGKLRYEENIRSRSEAAVQGAIGALISQITANLKGGGPGVHTPIIVAQLIDDSSGALHICQGVHRSAAALKAGMMTINAIVYPPLTKRQFYELQSDQGSIKLMRGSELARNILRMLLDGCKPGEVVEEYWGLIRLFRNDPEEIIEDSPKAREDACKGLIAPIVNLMRNGAPTFLVDAQVAKFGKRKGYPTTKQATAILAAYKKARDPKNDPQHLITPDNPGDEVGKLRAIHERAPEETEDGDTTDDGKFLTRTDMEKLHANVGSRFAHYRWDVQRGVLPRLMLPIIDSLEVKAEQSLTAEDWSPLEKFVNDYNASLK